VIVTFTDVKEFKAGNAGEMNVAFNSLVWRTYTGG
jgi:hypothetical protein